MGYALYRMIRDGAPPEWTGPMIHVAQAIADDARDPDGSQENYPWSAVPIKGHFDGRGRWRDGLAERTGMSPRAISRALADLSAAGYEMRRALGTGKDGRVVFTAPGRAMRFQVPLLPPRPVPLRSPRTASERMPRTASVVDPRNGERSPSTPVTLAKDGDPFPSGPLTSKAKSLVMAGVEGARAPAREASPPDLRTRAGTEQARMVATNALTEWTIQNGYAFEQPKGIPPP